MAVKKLPVHILTTRVDVSERRVAADSAFEQATVAKAAGGLSHIVGACLKLNIHGDVCLVP